MPRGQKTRDVSVAVVQPAYARYREPLYERLARHYRVTFLFMREPYAHFRHQYYLTFLQDFSVEKLGSSSPISHVIAYFDLFVSLMKGDFSVIIVSNPYHVRSFISFLVSRIKNIKYVMWMEKWADPTPESFLSRFVTPLAILLGARILKNADAVIVEGESQYRYTSGYRISERKIFLANHCSLDFSQYDTRDLKGDLEIEDRFIILFVGRIEKYKGLDVLIRAFSLIEKERDDASLVIVGDGSFRSFCESLVEKLEARNVFFLGAVSEEEKLASCYKASDVLVLPSFGKAEGWGLVINEAMSMETPIVTTDAVGAAQDLVQNGINGFVVEGGNVDDLYLALSRILKDKELREEMGRNSRRIFEEFNDFDKMFEGFNRALEYAT